MGRDERSSGQPEFRAALHLIQQLVPDATEIILQFLTDLCFKLFAAGEDFDVEDIVHPNLNFQPGVPEVVGTPHL